MDNKTSTLYCSPCVSTDLGQIEDLAASENQIILSKENLNLNNVQEIQHQSISNIAINDSDDESEKPTVSVVIDDDEAHISTENDQSEITSTTAEEIPSCFVDDHDYFGLQSFNRTTSGYFGDNNEPFPVLEGLESYIGDDNEEQYDCNLKNRNNFEQRRYRGGRDDIHNRVTSSVPTVINSNSLSSRVQQVRTVYRGDSYNVAMGGTRVPNRRNQPPISTLFNQRRIIHQGEFNSLSGMRTTNTRALDQVSGNGYRYLTSFTNSNNRLSLTPNNNTGYTNAALITNDPSRAANDVAPAPLVIPACGTKTIQRNRIFTSNRNISRDINNTVMVNTNYTQSPRKVYQVSRNTLAPDYVPPPENMHTYVKVLDNCDSNSPTVSSSGNARLSKEITDSNSAAIIDVVDEEEAQNAKFFQRNIGILPIREKQTRHTSFNDVTQQIENNQTSLKSSSNEQQNHIQSINQQQESPTSQRFRSIHNIGLHNVPTILQRGNRLQPNQLPIDFETQIEHQQDVPLYLSHDHESIIASKNVQRPRGRPRGRVSFSSSGITHISINENLNRQQQNRTHSQQNNLYDGHIQQQEAIFSEHQRQITNSDNNINVVSSQFLDSTLHERGLSSNGEFHCQQQNEQSINLVDKQQQNERSSSYTYKQKTSQPQINDQNVSQNFHSTQHGQEHQAQNIEFVNSNNVSMHQQCQNIVDQQQYQGLEDLAELAQLSQQQQQFINSTQRPIFQIPNREQHLIENESQLANQSQYYFNNEQTTPNFQTFGIYNENEQIQSNMYDQNIKSVQNSQKNIKKLSLRKAISECEKKEKIKKKKKENKTSNRLKKSTNSDLEEWAGEDYITRCVCNMIHNDEFMIECERCKVWQHGVCMGISSKNVPEMYFCEICDPRSLKHTQQQAAALQQRKLLKLEDISQKSKERKKQKLCFKPKHGKLNSTLKKYSPLKKRFILFRNFIEITENNFSRGLRSFIQQTKDLGNVSLLNSQKGEILARQMFVASNVEGLVATHDIAAGSLVIKYSGCFSLAKESSLREKFQIKNNFILKYTGFGEDNAIIIDASKMGSAARFARRSCRPNTTIQHAIQNGSLHIFLVATENIDFSAEITIPFDYDYTTSQVFVECACGLADDQFNGEDCEVMKFNRALSMTKEAVSLNTKNNLTKTNTMIPTLKRSSRLSSGIDNKNKVSSKAPAAKKIVAKSLSTLLKGRSKLRRKNLTEKKSFKSTYSSPSSRKSRLPRLLKISNKECDESKKISKPITFSLKEEQLKSESEIKFDNDGINETVIRPRRSTRRNSSPSMIIENLNDMNSDSAVLSNSSENILPKSSKNIKDVSTFSKLLKTSLIVEKNNQTDNEKFELKTKETKQKLIDSPSEIFIRRTRSTQAKENDFKNIEVKSNSNQNIDKSKLSREERKLQETLAVIERYEHREKIKKERRSNEQRSSILLNKKNNSSMSFDKKIKLEPDSFKTKRSSRLLSSSLSSVASSTSSININNKVGRNAKRSSISSQSVNELSPLKKHRTSVANERISHAEAAQLLTEMATCLKSNSNDNVLPKKIKIDNLYSQIVCVAEIALAQNEITLRKDKKSTSDFNLGDDFKLSSSLNLSNSSNKTFDLVSNTCNEDTEATKSNIEKVNSVMFETSNKNIKLVKKLTLDEYKRRKSSTVVSTFNNIGDSKQFKSFKQSKNQSFMPSFKEISTTSNMKFSESQLASKLPSFESSINSDSSPKITSDSTSLNINEDSLSLDELKKRIYGEKLSATKLENEKDVFLIKTTVSPLINNLISTPSTSTTRLSLDERLQKQFGIGKSSVTILASKDDTLSTTSIKKSVSTSFINNSSSKSQSNRIRTAKQIQKSDNSNLEFLSTFETTIVPPPPPPTLNSTARMCNQRRLH